MFDSEALAYSEKHLPEVVDHLLASRPNLREIYTTNLAKNAKRDYWQRIDATGVSASKTYTIQIKCRMPGHDDFVLTAHKLTDPQAIEQCQGFWWNGNKYSFSVFADIYAEYLGDGSIFSITREEIEALESKFPDELSECISLVKRSERKDSDGEYFPIDEYDVYITQSGLANALFLLLRCGNDRVDQYFMDHI